MENPIDYIKFIASSLVVIGILFIILKYSKTIQKKHRSHDIKMIDRLPTGPQSTILLLNIKGHEYVVGATNHSIHLIDKL